MMVKELSFNTRLTIDLLKLSSILSIRGKILLEGATSLSHIYSLLQFLRYETRYRFEILTDLFAIDKYTSKKRFQLFYILISPFNMLRMKVTTRLKEFQTVPSICDLYSSANWLERESWDMFGLFFANHCDLRRLLTDYGFVGYPLRKDFPVVGYFETNYDDEQRHIILQPVKMTQDFRTFVFKSPWVTRNVKINFK